MVVVREAHVVVLKPVEAMHHVVATRIHSGLLALVSHVVVDVLLPFLLQQLREVVLVLVQISVPLFTNPLQLIIWLDAVGVKVLVETVVSQGPCPTYPRFNSRFAPNLVKQLFKVMGGERKFAEVC